MPQFFRMSIWNLLTACGLSATIGIFLALIFPAHVFIILIIVFIVTIIFQSMSSK